MPTIFHITHWKAGSQWINKILHDCLPYHIVEPQVDEVQFLDQPLQLGKVYPTVYVTKEQFDSVRLPSLWERFVIIRDLRDSLISAYFSIKVSHPLIDPRIEKWRRQVNQLSREEGLIYLIEEWLPYSLRIQKSWAASREKLIRYEDLLEKDSQILQKVLLVDCKLPVSRDKLESAISANRFRVLTKGRERGTEDITAHERKGISGDWRNYFSQRLKEVFKQRTGDLLMRLGYENDHNW